MGTEIYVVMTGKEIRDCGKLPEKIAYLGCHFGGNGLVGLPDGLPEGSMLLIDDRVVPQESDIESALAQLKPLLPKFSGIYLDFQREETPKEAANLLVEKLPFPVGVPKRFGIGIPVLPPRQLNLLPGDYYHPGCWTEAAMTAWELTVTKDGCSKKEVPRKKDFSGHYSEILYCSYSVEMDEEKAVFVMQNNRELLHREILEDNAPEKWLVLYRDWMEE